MGINDKARDAAINLVMRANDLDDMTFLTDTDAALVRDLKAAVSEVFESVMYLLDSMRAETAA